MNNTRTHAGQRTPEPIVGVSPWAVETRAAVVRLAASQGCVLMVGPPGTGKQHIAREIHARSQRAQRPLAVVDCGAISGQGLLNCLFGYAQVGRNTTMYPSTGCLQEAEGGTVFLEEAERLDLLVQTRRLRHVG